jgi:hypothetical protein
MCCVHKDEEKRDEHCDCAKDDTEPQAEVVECHSHPYWILGYCDETPSASFLAKADPFDVLISSSEVELHCFRKPISSPSSTYAHPVTQDRSLQYLSWLVDDPVFKTSFTARSFAAQVDAKQ